jgi:hypothetical protein
MWTGDAEVIFEVGEERDRLKSFAEALLRGLSSRKSELLRRVPSRQRGCHLDHYDAKRPSS